MKTLSVDRLQNLTRRYKSGGKSKWLILYTLFLASYLCNPQQSWAEAGTQALRVQIAGGVNGLVVSNDGILICDSNSCQGSYKVGTEVKLTAIPTQANTQFAGWSASFCTKPDLDPQVCRFIMEDNLPVLTATFQPFTPKSSRSAITPVTLLLLKSGESNGLVVSNDGRINCDFFCTQATATYNSPIAEYKLTAIPSPNVSRFVGWSAGSCTIPDPDPQVCRFPLDINKTVTATFEPVYLLKVILGGSGTGQVTSSPLGIDCPPTCEFAFPAGTIVNLNQQPANQVSGTGWFFNGWQGPCNGKSATCVLNLNKNNISVNANFGAIRQDSVVFDFFNYGIWLWNNNDPLPWSQIHPLSSEQIVSADLDGNDISDLVMNFGTLGLWVWMNNQPWVQLHNTAVNDAPPTNIVAADLKGTGKASDLAVNYTNPLGLYRYYGVSQAWAKLNGSSSKSITPAFMDENKFEDLSIDFNPNAMWVWLNDQSWFQLFTPTEPNTIFPTANAAGDFDGNGHSDLAYSFGPSGGLWIYWNNQSWKKLHNLSPSVFIPADLDGNGYTDLVVNFDGIGIFAWMNYPNNPVGIWVNLHPLTPRTLAAAYLDDNAKQDLILDFYPPYGIWLYMNNGPWEQLVTGPKSKQIVAKPK